MLALIGEMEVAKPLMIHPYAQFCVQNKVKIMNVKVFHLISRTNETTFLVQDESCNCKCRLQRINP